MDQLHLQDLEKAIGDRIINVVALGAHASVQVVLVQEGLPPMAVLAALVRVDHQPLWHASPPKAYLQSLADPALIGGIHPVILLQTIESHCRVSPLAPL